MKQVYTISEVGNMLGLGIDAIRFYEKKGLVHPKSNPNNQYREYSLMNILELLDVIYYRHLDISVGQIQEILASGTGESTQILLKNKRIAVEKKIRYEKQLVKKLALIEAFMERVDEQNNICSICDFPQSYILYRTNEINDEVLWELPKLTTEQYVLCSIINKYTFDHSSISEEESFIVLEKKILQDLKIVSKGHHYESIQKTRCIYMAKKIEHFDLLREDIEPLLQYAKQHNIKHSGIIMAKDVSLTSFFDKDNYFVELFLPILEQ